MNCGDPDHRKLLPKRLSTQAYNWRTKEAQCPTSKLLLSRSSGSLFSYAIQHQLRLCINIGVAPVRPYGYFDYDRTTASVRLYGPDWFVGGVFLEPAHGSTARTALWRWSKQPMIPAMDYHRSVTCSGPNQFNNFHGNEARDGQGHTGNAGHSASSEHALPGYHGGSSHGGGNSGGGHPSGGHPSGGSQGGGHH